MNSQIRKLAIIAFAAALPLGLAAQSGSTGSTTSGTSGSSSDTTRSGSSTTGSSSRDQSSSTHGTSGSSMSSPSSTGSSTGSSGAGHSSAASSTSSGLHGISRVDQDSIKQQFTATDLIGKDVYDNGGKKVGEVKDLVLGSAAASHLAMAFANTGSSDDATSSSRSTTGATSGSSSTGTATGATGASGTASTSRIAGTDRMSGTGSTSGTSRTSGSTGSTLGSEVSSAFNSMSGMASEPAAIVSLGGFMGMGDNLVRVPLSQLNYDSSKERLTLALSETELSSLTDRNSTRNAAE